MDPQLSSALWIVEKSRTSNQVDDGDVLLKTNLLVAKRKRRPTIETVGGESHEYETALDNDCAKSGKKLKHDVEVKHLHAIEKLRAEVQQNVELKERYAEDRDEAIHQLFDLETEKQLYKATCRDMKEHTDKAKAEALECQMEVEKLKEALNAAEKARDKAIQQVKAGEEAFIANFHNTAHYRNLADYFSSYGEQLVLAALRDQMPDIDISSLERQFPQVMIKDKSEDDSDFAED